MKYFIDTIKDDAITYSVEDAMIEPSYYDNYDLFTEFLEMSWVDISITSANNQDISNIQMGLSSNEHLKRALLSLAETLL